MSGRGLRSVIAAAGAIWAVTAEAVSLGNGQVPSAALLHLSIGLTYLFGGLAIWGHEPANRTGRLMTAVGLTWFIGPLGETAFPVVNEAALAIGDTVTILLVALVLAYPSGRLSSSFDRAALAVVAVGATALNVLYSTSLPWIADKSGGLYGGLALASLTAIAVVRRWLVEPARSRRDLLPVLIAGLVFTASLIINILRRIAVMPDDTGALLVAIRDLAPAAIPVALLIGFYRQSERRLRAVVDAIPDQMLRFTRTGAYLASPHEASGASHDLPAGRALHARLFETAGPPALEAAARALDSGRLQAFDFALDLAAGRRELEVRVAPSGPDEVTAIVRDFTEVRAAETEVRESRARIVEATDEARRRLERDLHDGAQQRLVTASLALRRLQARLAGDPAADTETRLASEESASELKSAILELRELARGIHPAILTEAGLGPALAALAERSTVPATVRSVPDRRLSSAVEATAYFVVSEAVANVAKYARASNLNIAADSTASTLRIEVGDDGVGGVDPARGTGIRGLQDRVAAHGGRLSIDSHAGQGTLVVAEIPIG